MNTRRKFLLTSGLASAAMIASKPLKAIATSGNPFSSDTDINTISLLHTQHFAGISEAVSSLKKNKHTLLFDTSDCVEHSNRTATTKSLSQLDYHAVLPATQHVDAGHSVTMVASNGKLQSPTSAKSVEPYKIIYKGDVKIGIIGAVNAKNQSLVLSGDTLTEVNTVAAYLKLKQDCKFVICLSNLGYYNKQAFDDSTLAAASEHIDLIVGNCHDAHPGNATKVVLNKNQSEVILNYTGSQSVSIGSIQIGFDSKGNKKNIEISNVLS